jgi:hypothetical protein
MEKIVFVLFSSADLGVYTRELESLAGQ